MAKIIVGIHGAREQARPINAYRPVEAEDNQNSGRMGQ